MSEVYVIDKVEWLAVQILRMPNPPSYDDARRIAVWLVTGGKADRIDD